LYEEEMWVTLEEYGKSTTYLKTVEMLQEKEEVEIVYSS
jgi:hypothetical protein